MSLPKPAIFLAVLVLALGAIAQTPSDSTDLIAVKRADPAYPLIASRGERQGQVIVRVRISETGTVEDAAIVSGDPVFQPAAIEAMKKWSFQPYIKNGKPIKVTTDFPVSFVIQSRVKEYPERLKLPNIELESAPGAASEDLNKIPGRTKVIYPPDVRVPASDSKTEIIRQVIPIYPESPKREGIQGTVLLNATIRPDGFVGLITPISGPKELLQASIDAVSLWRFRPFALHGKRITAQIVLQVNYTLTRL
jgi:TonB family protein